MADMALAEAFGAMNIEKRGVPAQQTHHAVSFAYPDLTIRLRSEETVKLTPPAKVEFRSRPPQDSRDLAIYDTDFALAVPLEKDHVPDGYQPSTEYMRLFAAIEVLRRGAGSTVVGVVRVYHEIWKETAYRFRLETNWDGPFPKTPPQDIELSGADWEALMAFAGKRPWIRLLQDLVTRVSAKAYYHVRQRILAKCGPEGVVKEESSWSTRWGTKPYKHASELFCRRLTPINENIMAGKMPELRLECGHGFRLTGIDAARIDDVLSERCETCHVEIFRPEDEQYLIDMSKNRMGDRYHRMQKVWTDLVSSMQEPEKPRRFHATTIFRILEAALDSLRTPEWVAPLKTCPTRFEETELVLEHLESIFYEKNHWYEKTAEQLLADLEKEALGVRVGDVRLRDKVNPPGWDDFLARWLRRTAYFLAYRKCDGSKGDSCNGLHWHNRDGLWYTPNVWEKTEEERFEDGDTASFSMSDIMKSLEKIKV